ncbi:MAG: hypothetical protein ACFFCQ_00575 [Promethearchaeota archaeon]
MSSKNTVSLLCEPCPICKKPISLFIDISTFPPPNITGLSTVADSHGLLLKPSHIRILHIDIKREVRAWEVVTAITINDEMLSNKVKVDIMQEEIQRLQKQLLELKNMVLRLEKTNEDLKHQLEEYLKSGKLKEQEVENLLIQRIRPVALLNTEIFSQVQFIADKNSD